MILIYLSQNTVAIPKFPFELLHFYFMVFFSKRSYGFCIYKFIQANISIYYFYFDK